MYFTYSIFILYMYSIYILHIFYIYSIYWIQYIPLSLKQSVSNRVCVSFVDWTRWQFRARIGQRTPAKNTKCNIWQEYISKSSFCFCSKKSLWKRNKISGDKIERKLIFYQLKYKDIGLTLLVSSLCPIHNLYNPQVRIERIYSAPLHELIRSMQLRCKQMNHEQSTAAESESDGRPSKVN